MKMKKLWSSVCCLSATALLWGCSQGAQKEQPARKEPVSPPVQVVEPAPAGPRPAHPQPLPTRPDFEETVYPKDNELPIRMCTLLQGGERDKVGLVDRRTGKQDMVRQGQTFSGYEVVKIDAQNEQVVLRKDGKEYSLSVSESGADDRPVAPVPSPVPQVQAVAAPAPVELPDQLSPNEPDLSSMPPPEQFVPTPEEISAGIDPNDASTWPKTYRGPGIERAIKAQREATGQ